MLDQPFGLDRSELPCTFIPDGYEGSRAAFVGFDRLELRAIWFPNDYQGPQPGYPWVEFGRMTLPSERTALARQGLPSGTGTEAVDTGVTTGRSAAARGLEGAARPLRGQAPGGAQTVGTPDDGMTVVTAPLVYTYPDIDAAMQAWYALRNPSATLAALDALSASNPVVKTLARKGVKQYRT